MKIPFLIYKEDLIDKRDLNRKLDFVKEEIIAELYPIKTDIIISKNIISDIKYMATLIATLLSVIAGLLVIILLEN